MSPPTRIPDSEPAPFRGASQAFAGRAIAHDQAPTTRSPDWPILERVHALLSAARGFSGAELDIVVSGGGLTIEGLVREQRDLRSLQLLLQQLEGVGSIDNRVVLRPR